MFRNSENPLIQKFSKSTKNPSKENFTQINKSTKTINKILVRPCTMCIKWALGQESAGCDDRRVLKCSRQLLWSPVTVSGTAVGDPSYPRWAQRYPNGCLHKFTPFGKYFYKSGTKGRSGKVLMQIYDFTIGIKGLLVGKICKAVKITKYLFLCNKNTSLCILTCGIGI